MKKEKYRVTGPLGVRSFGVIDCFVIQVDPDSGKALVMHNPKPNECGCFEIAEKVDGRWQALEGDVYVNFEKMPDCIKL